MAGKMTFDELKKKVASGEIDTVVAAQVDMQGRLMGKRFHAQFFVDSAWKETHSCNYLLATDMEMETVPGYKATSWAAGYGDYTMKPDMATLRLPPWLEGTALVLCDVQDHKTHDDVPHSPRAVLKGQIARLEAMGFRAMAATELEFFLFDQSYADLNAAGYRGMKPASAYNEDYHIFQTTKEEEVMRAIRNGLNGAGMTVECSKGEASAGQEEINILYGDALTTADNHAVVKNGCKEIAFLKGKAISFMAKWDDRAAGSSSHIHQSLAGKDGKPAFHDGNAEYGMSTTMQRYLAGLLAHAGEITYFLAPNINSYKRFQAGTFAPTKAIWSRDNRTAGYRVCGEGTKAIRIECRIGGADLNPYLALAAQIAAGIDGIENKRELEVEFVGDAYGAKRVREIPKTLRDAAAALDKSRMLRQAFGDDVVDHYVHAASWEQAEYDRRVTDWEISRGFKEPESGFERLRTKQGKDSTIMTRLTCISPIDGSTYIERDLEAMDSVKARLGEARTAQKSWAKTPLAERSALVNRAIQALDAMNDEIVPELARQMGRPVRYGGEMGGVKERTAHMIAIAESALAPAVVEDSGAFRRVLAREPAGIVFVVAPWNYPFLTAVNTIVPALIAGNAVMLKHATQTLLAGERLGRAFKEAGLPDGLFTNLRLSHDMTEELLRERAFDFVNFTGSVKGGRAIERAAAGTFVGIGLELGGKDPGYVRADADLDAAVAGLIDGAMFNSGQCCCGIERIYVHESLYDAFVAKAAALVAQYRLGDPLDPDTTLGPMASLRFADEVRAQTEEAVAAGARTLIDPALFPADTGDTAYLAPQILVDVDHSMRVMREESFGPVVGIMKVSGDEEAIALMNDTAFGLTASIWTRDTDAAAEIGMRIESGTVFMNRCDYLDPALCWTGCKETGRGAALSVLGFHSVTRPKSYHLKKA